MARKHNKTYLVGLKPLLTGRNQGEVAEELHIDQSTLSGLANCRRGASLEMTVKLADYLQKPIDTLIGREIPLSS